MNRKALTAAFPATVPVLMGYLAIGMAFGLMLETAGYGVGWALLMSMTIYAGSGQYLGVSLLATGASLSQVAFLTLMINFRHLVYGLSMLEKFRGMGARKFYMIFSLTDETYALLSSARAPAGVEEHDYYFAVAMLDHSYWILGSVLGSVLGAALGLDTTGVDFAMTALFLVIAVGQWKKAGSHLPALLGGAATLLSLMLVGAEEMLLPALGLIVFDPGPALSAVRPRRASPKNRAVPGQGPAPCHHRHADRLLHEGGHLLHPGGVGPHPAGRRGGGAPPPLEGQRPDLHFWGYRALHDPCTRRIRIKERRKRGGKHTSAHPFEPIFSL